MNAPAVATARAASPLAQVAWVVLGGALGTLARYAVGMAVGDVAGVPLGIFVINVTGAFALGLLLEALALRGSDHGARRTMRLLLGTGVLGGFTTYSLLATDVAELLLSGNVLGGLGYGLATLVCGGAATWLGVVLAQALPRSRGHADGATK